jgi:hypothetical protein
LTSSAVPLYQETAPMVILGTATRVGLCGSRQAPVVIAAIIQPVGPGHGVAPVHSAISIMAAAPVDQCRLRHADQTPCQ